MYYKAFFFSALIFCANICLAQKTATIQGTVRGGEKQEALEFATIFNKESGLWCLTDSHGKFELKDVPCGSVELEVRIIGYCSQIFSLALVHDTTDVEILLAEDNLRLKEVSISAQVTRTSETTSYVIHRAALAHSQILNISDVTSFLPGGQSNGDLSLMSDQRLALRSQGGTEMGNPSFGTAIEMDGQRLSTNNEMSLSGSSTRMLPASNIESVEVITGIASVEHGDLSNGIVKVHTQKGKQPWTIDATTKPHTRILSVSKGWLLHQGGLMNIHLERARSFSNLTSPYTSYVRNVATLNYTQKINKRSGMPLLLTLGMSGNYGGYNSENDPDNTTDTYSRIKDHYIRGYLQLQWQFQKPGITSLELWGGGSYANKKTSAKSYTSSASSQAQIHATEQGYFVGTEYDENPSAPILLSPIGYWHRQSYTDNRPVDLSGHLKYKWNTKLGPGMHNRVKAGIEYHAQGNEGRGNYYNDLRTAPSWREARYDTLPYLQSLSIYAEEHLEMPLGKTSSVSITAGVRNDLTNIKGSDYGKVSAYSPRISTRITGWKDPARTWSELNVHGGFGKAVKLPSFQVLYPSTSYSDQLAFAPGTMSDGRTFYAFHCAPSKAIYNPNLKWQYSLQGEMGIETRVGGHRISLSLYRTTTYHPYLSTALYTPYAFSYTGQEALENSSIPSENRTYSIDQQTGIVTVTDRTGTQPDETLAAQQRLSYLGNTHYVNGSESTRNGIEWVIDFARIEALQTEIRCDGQATFYRGEEHTLMQYRPSGTLTMANGQPYRYIGYYDGSTTVGNGSLTRQVNTNITVTTHIPAIRMIFSVRLESSLYQYSRNLQSNGIIPESISSYEGTHSNHLEGHYVIVYPKYYSDWANPTRLIPFEEALLEAKENDKALYQELIKLIERSNTNYYFKGNRISPYLAGHLNLTKEIGDHVSVTFQATNFWNHTGRVKSSQTASEATLYGSGYIQSFYYGLSLKIKI